MMKNKPAKKPLGPVLLSRVLMIALALVIVLTGAGYYFATKLLSSTVIATDHAKTDADIAESNIDRLKGLQSQLANQQDILDRAAQIVAESKLYRYQDQIVNDINTFASRAGVNVIGYDFSAAQALTGTTGNSIPGVQSIDATVNLESPLSYTSFLKFLKAIEQNLTKMQVTGISITPSDNNPDKVNNPSVGLVIYIKG